MSQRTLVLPAFLLLILSAQLSAFEQPAIATEPIVAAIGWTDVDGEWVPQLDVQLRMQASPLWTVGLQVAPILSDPKWKNGSLDFKRYGLVASPRVGLGGLIFETPIELSAVNGSYLYPSKDENGRAEIFENGGWGFALTASLVVAQPITDHFTTAVQIGWRQGWIWVHGVDENAFTGAQVAVQFRWLP